MIGYFNVIWDDADELQELARISHPRIVVDTSRLVPEATEFANLVAEHITHLGREDLAELIHQVKLRSGRNIRKTGKG